MSTPILEAVKRPNMYVKLNLFIHRDLTSKHSLALYEVLKDYQNIKKIEINVDDLRKLVGLEDGQYKIFTMFKKRVIDVAVDEINEKTELQVSYELLKEGRKITSICFAVGGQPFENTTNQSNTEILNKLEAYGVKKRQAQKLIENHDEDYILGNIRVVEEELKNGKDIRNVTGYLMKAFDVDFRPVETEYDKAKNAKKRKAEQEAAIKAENEKELKKRQRTFEKNKEKAVENLLKDLDQTVLKSLKEEFISSIKDNTLFSKMMESKGFESGTIQTQRRKFVAEKHLPRELYDFDFHLKQKENGAVEYVSEK